MTFPIETEATIRGRMLNICQDHGRRVVDVTRELALMLDAIVAGKQKEVKTRYDSIQKILQEADKIKAVLLSEVASIGTLLLNRDDFLRLVFLLSEISDDAEAVAFRLDGIIEKKWKIDKKYLQSTSELMTLMLEEMTRMRDTMMTLNLNPAKAVETARAVEAVERKIDTAQRNLTFDVISSEMELHLVLILWDIVRHLEGMADTGVDVVDLVRLLAVTG
ncbi:MAG: DUF47 family protein [archaeon]